MASAIEVCDPVQVSEEDDPPQSVIFSFSKKDKNKEKEEPKVSIIVIFHM